MKPLKNCKSLSLHEKYPYSEYIWSAFSRIETEYVEIRSISPYSLQMRENADQKKSEYEHFSRSVPRVTMKWIWSIISFCSRALKNEF